MRKLYRSTRDKKIFGICGGLGEYFGIDTTLLRVLLIIVAVFSAGSVILVYIIAGFVIPREPIHGGYGSTPPPYGWGGREQPQYGSQSWSNHGPSWSHAPQPPQPPQPPRPPAPDYGKPPVYTAQATPASRPAQEIDKMMEEMETKALRKEIEELKAKLNKIERESKGE
ncbi:PspC domain-containing protein [Cohnella panacarvi]|uniref:PspC domain-containing protein n=1 Tax=Cohnella panacarvi TaxID=400776 RepID=UPI00047B5C15|nr:PspC domain-containing protein [Cohnella panacarvi]